MDYRFRLLLIVLLNQFLQLSAQENPTHDDNPSPVRFISGLYEAVSSEPGEEVDWERVKSYFSREAVIVLRTSPAIHTSFDLDGFILDFMEFYKTPVVVRNGFIERVLEYDLKEYKDMAFVWIVYEAHIPESGRVPQKGLDFWLLQKTENGWKVIAVTNEVIPVGEEFQ